MVGDDEFALAGMWLSLASSLALLAVAVLARRAGVRPGAAACAPAANTLTAGRGILDAHAENPLDLVRGRSVRLSRHRVRSAGDRRWPRRTEIEGVRDLQRQRALPGRAALLRPRMPAHGPVADRRLPGHARRPAQGRGELDAAIAAYPPRSATTATSAARNRLCLRAVLAQCGQKNDNGEPRRGCCSLPARVPGGSHARGCLVHLALSRQCSPPPIVTGLLNSTKLADST